MWDLIRSAERLYFWLKVTQLANGQTGLAPRSFDFLTCLHLLMTAMSVAEGVWGWHTRTILNCPISVPTFLTGQAFCLKQGKNIAIYIQPALSLAVLRKLSASFQCCSHGKLLKGAFLLFYEEIYVWWPGMHLQLHSW